VTVRLHAAGPLQGVWWLAMKGVRRHSGSVSLLFLSSDGGLVTTGLFISPDK
jgi:hypothetical protein